MSSEFATRAQNLCESPRDLLDFFFPLNCTWLTAPADGAVRPLGDRYKRPWESARRESANFERGARSPAEMLRIAGSD